jgi:hypothetical protein
VCADAESGRGLALVDALTGGQWGVAGRVGVGKMVWAVRGRRHRGATVKPRQAVGDPCEDCGSKWPDRHSRAGRYRRFR